MRKANEVRELYNYRNELLTRLEKYNSVKKVNSNAGGNDCDKFNKEIKATIKFDCYMGYYGSSSVSASMPEVKSILNEAISRYLTDKFDEVIKYSSNYIKD